MSNELFEPSMETDSSPIAPATLAYADASTPRPEQIGMASGITRGDVAALTVRLLGLYIILQGLSSLLFVISSLLSVFRYGDARLYLPIVMVFAVLETIGILMAVKASLIGRWLLPKTPISPGVAPGSGSPIELQSAAFGVVGVLLATWAIPEIGQALWRYTYESLQSRPHEQSGLAFMGLLIKPIIELLLGLWLFFGSKRLSLYWQKMRGPRAVHDGDADGDAGPL